ncbi:TetR/AcrR family transcriptional repressor of nem operon [Saccharothrix tamanrassetensis]|uniref:TetR/AcrR family transcriptional repressor of nem operon n=1 Tax=Saccharothrix tamanrassetensis TaxID=1051531 RepID=A0A841CSM9_9PSEU|nr:TetR/AcrR family transcriptional regulator [Saccharothrix tamanrassetensis]MBB5960270.1 TetR/AcrR family transcriptional repressor of nem operon [Saccharothrix tamanrassetensis]
MGRTSESREKLIGAACELMRGRGYGAIGVAEICERAGVRKGSFYYFFESKQALTVEALRAAWAVEGAAWRAILGTAEDPLRRLERLCRSQAEAQHRSKREAGSVHGCLFGNLALELGNQDEVVRGCLKGIFDEQVDLVHEVLLDAHRAGDLPAERATRAYARAVLAQVEGMVLFAKLDNEPVLLEGLWPQIAGLLRGV